MKENNCCLPYFVGFFMSVLFIIFVVFLILVISDFTGFSPHNSTDDSTWECIEWVNQSHWEYAKISKQVPLRIEWLGERFKDLEFISAKECMDYLSDVSIYDNDGNNRCVLFFDKNIWLKVSTELTLNNSDRFKETIFLNESEYIIFIENYEFAENVQMKLLEKLRNDLINHSYVYYSDFSEFKKEVVVPQCVKAHQIKNLN